MKEQIAWTNNYDKFELLDFNRDIGNTKQLEESMIKFGFLAAHPIHCVKSGSRKLKIKAGHHRFYVARKLGLLIPYVVCNDQASIFDLEGPTRRWSLNDFLTAHIREGKKTAS